MNFKAFIIDIDGVLYRGHQGIPGAKEALEFLLKGHFPIVFLTNITNTHRLEIAKRLKERIGIEIHSKQILSAPYLTRRYLKEKGIKECCLLVSPNALKEFRGIKNNYVNPKYIVLGDLEGNFTYPLLNKILGLLFKGTKLIAMQTDPYEVYDGSPILNLGAWVSLLEKASGKKAIVIGKPSLYAFRLAIETLKIEPKNIAMIGDSVTTDLIPAKKLGVGTILVKTGVKNAKKLINPKNVNYVLPSIKNLPDLLKIK